MALTKKQKQDVVDELRGDLKDAKTMVFVSFKGLSVGDTNKLRKSLREAGVGYRVAKKTLLGRALDEKNISGNMPEILGEVAVAYSTDMLAPAREVFNFSKGKQTPKIIGGVFEGTYADSAKMLAIATIPSRDVLLAQFLNIINSPIQQFAVVINQIAEKKA